MKKIYTITMDGETISTNNNGLNLIELLGALQFAVLKTTLKISAEIQETDQKEAQDVNR